jgi:hypothetical protein
VYDIALGQHYFMNPIMERSFKVKIRLHKLVPPHREILKEFRKKSKQRKITDFMRPKTAIPAHVDREP